MRLSWSLSGIQGSRGPTKNKNREEQPRVSIHLHNIFQLLLKLPFSMDPILNSPESHASAPYILSTLSGVDDSRLPLSTVITSIVAFILTALCFLMYAGNDPFAIQDENGNKIPSGPRGIPILGKFRLH